MTKRGIAVLVSLIVMASGISAFALAPVLFANGDSSTEAILATGAADSVTDARAGADDDDLSDDSFSARSDLQAAKGAAGGSSGANMGAEGEQAANSQSPSGSNGGSGSGGGGGSGGGLGSGSGTGGAPSDSSAPSSSGGTPSAPSSSGAPSSDTSGNSAPSSQQPSQPASAPQLTVTLSIDADTVGRGYIMSPRTVAFSEGETVFDLLSRECRNAGIPMEHAFNPLYNSIYVEGINNLYEFDGGPQSGWMYSVNGWYPNYGCGAYTLSSGDVIKWRYTCNLGSDIGGSNAVGS